MQVRVLGAAAGGGFPQWNCNCRNCDGLRKGTIRAQARTQSSIAVSSNGVDWALFNASPDLLAQIKSFPALQPARGIRDTGIRAIVLVDGQIDHTTGLLMLREGKPLEIWCTDMVREDLSTGNPLFNILGHYCGVNWHRLPTAAASSFSIDGIEHLSFTAMPLKSKAPPYSPHRDNPHEGDNIGMRITDVRNGKSLPPVENNVALRDNITGLYTMLIAPIERDIKPKATVAFIPTGMLYYLPLHALAKQTPQFRGR